MRRVEHAPGGPAGVERGEVLESLYREHGDRIWRSVLAFAGDPEVASDAVAGASPRRFDEGRPSAIPNGGSGGQSSGSPLGSSPNGAAAPPSSRRSLTRWTSPARELVLALAKLSPKQRASVVLHHAAGYPVREVAAILESTPAAVNVHLLRGRNRLREFLGDDDA